MQALKLGKDLEAALKKFHENESTHEQMVSELTYKLNLTEEINIKLQNDIKVVQDRFNLDLDEQKKQMSDDILVRFRVK
jgi:hypothetical protein